MFFHISTVILALCSITPVIAVMENDPIEELGYKTDFEWDTQNQTWTNPSAPPCVSRCVGLAFGANTTDVIDCVKNPRMIIHPHDHLGCFCRTASIIKMAHDCVFEACRDDPKVPELWYNGVESQCVQYYNYEEREAARNNETATNTTTGDGEGDGDGEGSAAKVLGAGMGAAIAAVVVFGLGML